MGASGGIAVRRLSAERTFQRFNDAPGDRSIIGGLFLVEDAVFYQVFNEFMIHRHGYDGYPGLLALSVTLLALCGGHALSLWCPFGYRFL